MPSSTSPNMVLFLPVPGSTAGPQWAAETTSNWSTVDTHDHTAGKGVQIPIAALNVNADFSWLTYGQTNVGYLSLVDKLATGNLTVNASLGNVAGDPYWRNSSGVVKKLSLAGDALTIPSGTAALGSLLFTSIAAPSTPAAGKVIAWTDSTTRNWSTKDEFGNISVSVVPLTAPASQWFKAVAANGVFTTSQPVYSDISGAPVVIDNVAFSSVSSKSATAWSAGKFRRLELHLRVDSGTSGNAVLALTGLGGTYKSYNHYMLGSLGISNSTTQWIVLNAGPTSKYDLDLQIATGALRSYSGLGKDTTAEYNIVSGGMNSDTASNVTGLTVTFAGTSSGWFELIGYP